MAARLPAFILIISTFLIRQWSCKAWTNSLLATTSRRGLTTTTIVTSGGGNTPPPPPPPPPSSLLSSVKRKTVLHASTNQPDSHHDSTTTSNRRSWLLQQSTSAVTAAIMGVCSNGIVAPTTVAAASSSEAIPEVTDRIFLDIKGLGQPGGGENKRIVIGLFGKDAPRSTKMLKQLVTQQGLPAPCKPRAERTLQKEQLEANKVYNSCIESEKNGVTYDYSQIWRIIPNERIEVGAVTGKFIAREYPTWIEETDSGLKHNSPGIVSVRKGNDSGFGFTIFSGGSNDSAAALLDKEQIVVGRVENMEIVKELNDVSVIRNKGLTGGPALKSAPSRACTYGGTELYCNEYKPLTKLIILNSGVL